MRRALAATLSTFTIACAGGSSASAPGGAPAPQPAPAAAAVMAQAAQAKPVEPPKPKDIDPSGSYAVSLSYQGMPIAVTLAIWKNENGVGYAGSITADQVPAIALTNIAVSGKTVTAAMTSPDGAAVTMEFTIDGADLAGSWKSATDGSAMAGKKLP